jgi:hypothetical protein
MYSRDDTTWRPRVSARTESTEIRWFSRHSGGEAGLREQWPKATQGGPSGLSPFRSDGSCDGRQGGLTGCRRPKKLKTKLSSGQTTRLKSLRSDGSQVVRQEAGSGDRWPKMLNGKLISSFRQPGDLLQQAKWHPERNTQLTLSQGNLEDVRCCRVKMTRWEPQ